jgi:hypothetical protein
MMKSISRHFIVAFAYCALTAPNGYVRAQSPRKPEMIEELDFVDPGYSLEEAWAKADAVVRVKILGGEPKSLGQRSNGALIGVHVVTAQTVMLVEVLKRNLSLPSINNRFVMFERAGQADLGDRVITVAGPPPMKAGDDYVLFLHWNPSLPGFEPLAGPSGAFRIADRVEPRGQASWAKQQKGVPSDEFFRNLRRMVK